MRILIIEAIEDFLEAKRDLALNVSSNDIKKAFEAFTSGIIDNRSNNYAVRNAREYFTRKYNI